MAPSSLFYTLDDGQMLAYYPKKYNGSKTSLQSRNSLIGKFTENWCRELISEYASKNSLFAINGAVSTELSLTPSSPGDLVLSKVNSTVLQPEDIIMIFEIKQSITNNYKFLDNNIIEIGDYNTHQGNPSILRSDSVLKSIGKATNIKISSDSARNIPIIVLGNTPIKDTYLKKVDQLKEYKIIDGFWSLNPKPLKGKSLLKSPKNGFMRINSINSLHSNLDSLLSQYC